VEKKEKKMSQMNGKYPNPEVKIVRRRFSGEYKRRILKEADQCRHGELGALLRREGLYHSHLSTWRGQQESGELSGKRRGPRANPEAGKIKQLAQENAKLRRKLQQAEAIIEAQKKLARLLETVKENEQP
jgi:transposase-like protein